MVSCQLFPVLLPPLFSFCSLLSTSITRARIETSVRVTRAFFRPPRRILRRVQASIQYQTMENLHRLLQLLAHRRDHRREDFLLSRRPKPRPTGHGADPSDRSSDRCARHRPTVRPAVERSRQGSQGQCDARAPQVVCMTIIVHRLRLGLGRKRSWREFHIRCGRCVEVLADA